MQRSAGHPPAHDEAGLRFTERQLPDFEQRIYLPQKIAACIEECGQEGIAPEVVLKDTGLEIDTLYDSSTRASYRQFNTVLRNVLAAADDPAIVLRAGRRMHVTAFGIYGYALLSSPTYTDALRFASKYHQIAGPLCETQFLCDDRQVTYVFEPWFWPDPSEPVYRLCLEFAVSTHLTVAKDFHGPSFKFGSVDFAFDAPPHLASYHELFQCPVRFNCPRNALHFDPAWIDRPAVLADRATHALTRELCDQLSSEVSLGGGIAAEIRRILIADRGRFPSIEDIADRLALHPRALRRRLEANGTSYRDLLDDVRKRLAMEYLRKTHMTNEEIASRLSYSDAANFRRAFTRWTGRHPSEYRVA